MFAAVHFCLIVFLSFMNFYEGETCSGRNVGLNAGIEFGNRVQAASKDLKLALTQSTKQLTGSIDLAAYRLEQTAGLVTDEMGKSIRQVSSDLKEVSLALTNSIDKSVQEMSNVLREALNTTRDIADQLKEFADEAVVQVGRQVENAVNTVREIAQDLKNSIDKGVEEMGVTLRHVADKIAEAAKQINVNIDSNHLVGMANATRDGLVTSVQELTRNWKVAVNTADFKDVGEGAARELSKALQNLRGDFRFHGEIGSNLKEAVLYISVAGGIAFSVLFIAIVIALKSCRSCLYGICVTTVDKCTCCSSRGPRNEVVQGSKGIEELQSAFGFDFGNESSSGPGGILTPSKVFKDPTDFKNLRNKWEQQAMSDAFGKQNFGKNVNWDTKF